MNICEFARMIGEDIEILYCSESETFKATMHCVLRDSSETPVCGEDTFLQGALWNLRENLSCATLTVWKDYGSFTLKAPSMLLGDEWRAEP
jgi:hypothetical protein